MAPSSQSRGKQTSGPAKAGAGKASSWKRGILVSIAVAVMLALVMHFQKANAPIPEADAPPTPAEGCDRNADVPALSCIHPAHRCTRFTLPGYIVKEEAEAIASAFDHLLKTYGGGDSGGVGPVSLVDVSRGIVSYGPRFVDLYLLMKRRRDALVAALRRAAPDMTPQQIFDNVSKGCYQRENMVHYINVVRRLHFAVTIQYLANDPVALERAGDEAMQQFYDKFKGVFRLASPAFYSRIRGGIEPMSDNDEYWHTHVDLEQYGNFAVTTVSYLNNQTNTTDLASSGQRRFTGGSFYFEKTAADPLEGIDDDPAVAEARAKDTVHPEEGLVNAFVSGPQFPHRVGKVLKGERLALTTAFTCDRERGIPIDPPTDPEEALENNRNAVTFKRAVSFMSDLEEVIQGIWEVQVADQVL